MLNQSGQSSWTDPVRATQAGGYHARYVYEQPSKTRHEKLESLAKFDTVDVDNANGELVTTIYKLRLVISLPCTKNEHKWNSIKSAHAACVMKPWQTCHSFNHWKLLWPWRLTIVLLAYHKMQEQMAFTATWLGIKESVSFSKGLVAWYCPAYLLPSRQLLTGLGCLTDILYATYEETQMAFFLV